jgi:hypothetical protein
MTDNRKIFWFGSNSELREQCLPVEVSLQAKIPELFSNVNEFSAVKIHCTWSRTLSITNLVIADIRSLNWPYLKTQNALNTLGAKWDQDSIEPPYIETIAGIFPAINLKVNSPGKTKNGVRKRTSEEAVKLRMKKLVEMPEHMWTEEDKSFMRKILN